MSAAPTAPEPSTDNPISQHFTTISLLRFAFPTIFMMVFFGLYTVVDTMFIERFVNTNALSAFLFNAAMMRLRGGDGVAAIAIIIYAHFLLNTAYIGFFLGVSPVISYNHGSGNHRQLKRVCGICFRVIAVMSAAVFAVTYILRASLVGVFTPPGTAVYGMAVE